MIQLIAAARSYHTATTTQSAAKKYFLLGGASLLAGYSLCSANSTRYTVSAAEKTPINGVPGTKEERTFIAVKPDGVQRGLVGEIIVR